jgi:hypothetical protein
MECGVIGLEILQIRLVFLHSNSTAFRVICQPGLSPRKSQCSGLSTRHHARRISNSFGESNGKDRIMRRRWPGPAFAGARLKSTFSLIRRVSERVEPG